MPNVIVTRNSYPDAVALENVIHYVLDKAVVIGGYAVDCGSYAAAKEKGLVGLEGKDYVVKDGDVILFRFNV